MLGEDFLRMTQFTDHFKMYCKISRHTIHQDYTPKLCKVHCA